MNIPFRLRMRPEATDLQSVLQRLLSRHSRCRVLTRTRWGQRNALLLRLFNWNIGPRSDLWFLVPKGSGVALDALRDPEVSVEIANPSTRKAVRVEGRAKLVNSHHEPVYLHPSVQGAGVKVAADPLAFDFLRVELRSDSRARAVHEPDRVAA